MKKLFPYALVLVAVAIVVVVLGQRQVLEPKRQPVESKAVEQQPAENAAIKLGAILPLTGEAASYGEDCRRGVEMAVSDAKSNYKRSIDVIFEDSKADPKTAISAFNKLVKLDRVKGIVGDMFSSTTLAIAPLAQKEDVILLSPTAADEKIPATGDHVFSIYPPASLEGRFMGEMLKQKDISRVVVLYQNQTATKAIADSFSDTIEVRGGTVVLKESIPENKINYRTILEKVSAVRPTTIYISAYRDPVAMLIIAGKEMGVDVVYATQSTLYDEKALVDYANKLDGVLISGPYYGGEGSRKESKEFTGKYIERFSRPPSVWSAYGYDAASILIAAFISSEKNNSKPQNYLSGRVFNGLTGRTEIKKDRSVVKEMVLYKIKNNKFTQIK